MMTFYMLAQLLMYDIVPYAAAHKIDVPTMLFADGGISTPCMCPSLQILLGMSDVLVIRTGDFLDAYCSIAALPTKTTIAARPSTYLKPRPQWSFEKSRINRE
jgi:hypothetical protein